MRKILFSTLAVIGLVGVAWHSFFWWLNSDDMPNDATVSMSLNSPDGTQKAISYVQAGGGGMAPYCFELVSVATISTPDRKAWAGDFNVFAASCDSLWDMNWMSNDELRIAFDPNVGSAGIAALTLKGSADAGRIKITYALRDK